jgi:glycerate kinase
MIVVLAPDSFKGSLTAPEAADAMAVGLRRVWPRVEVRARPMADGGEGTLDAILHAAGGEAVRAVRSVPGAAGAPVDARYGVLGAGTHRVAVVEAAQVVGITDDVAMQVDAGRRNTVGVGMLVRALLDDGVRDFRIGLGGSSTSDGGAGLLAALGVRLLDAHGEPVEPAPCDLHRLARVDASHLDPRLAQAHIAILSDVNNPLTGPLGAVAVFGPQKGVRADDVDRFDATLERYAALAQQAIGRQAAHAPGAGAAGGLGFALQLLGGRMQSGAEVVADLIGLDAALRGADWAITGEGRSDRQTLLRKAPFVVAQRAAAQGVPVSLVSGAIDAADVAALGPVFAGCFGLPPGPATLAECIANVRPWLADRVEQVARAFAPARGQRAPGSVRV